MGKGVKGSKKGGKVEKERRSAQKEQALASKRAERAERKQHRKNKAKHSDDEDRRFAAQLREQGLRIVETAADGNCLFRALGDQLWGRERDHAALRKQLLEHEELASDTFKWFVEDDEPWDDYLCRLRRDAEWGGNLELVAAANVFACHVVVHQLAAPRLEIRADAPPGAAKRTLHLSLRSTCSMLAIRQSLARRSLAPSARALSAAAVEEPLAKPDSPNFSSGPCAKRPGWSPAVYGSAPVGRSHRSSIGKARLKEAIEKTRSVLGVPDDYRIGVVPASDTGAIEMAMWSMLGERPVDVCHWESFGKTWFGDVTNQLKLSDVTEFNAAYGELPDLAATRKDHDVVFTFNGTTSGVRVPDLDWIADDRTGLTFNDATSAVFAMDGAGQG
ncbi:O-phospho-L-serine:2-oxoglutarate aminotransferase [Aureococcus anophagefferens]|nr:O-phospho-L-serine:2-oxoglutarate aminotransferase [Aureococcus anophagefferens]